MAIGAVAVLGARMIEAQVTDAAAAVVADTGLDVSASGRTVRISGQVADPATATEIRTALAAMPIRVDDAITVVPEARPFRLEAWRTADGRVTLEGALPLGPAADPVLKAAASIPFTTLTDATHPARGMPAGDWPDMAARAIGILALLERGQVTIQNARVGISGTFDNPRQEQAIRSAVDPDWLIDLAPSPALRIAAAKADCTAFANSADQRAKTASDTAATARARIATLEAGLAERDRRVAILSEEVATLKATAERNLCTP